MNIENEIFIGKRPRFELLTSYGFTEIDGGYYYECDFMAGDFRAKIEIKKDGAISGRVLDNMTDEEYLPLRIDSRNGAFVNTVRGEYRKLLADIAYSCYSDLLFCSEQANRLAELIYNKYGIKPDFPWEGKAYKSCGIFRHPENRKWYALIMNIKRSLLDKSGEGSDMVDIINLKADRADICDLTQENGIYPAYHMSRRTWISVTLNDCSADERIMELIHNSYLLTMAKQ